MKRELFISILILSMFPARFGFGEEIDPSLDVVIVFDNSASMAESAAENPEITKYEFALEKLEELLLEYSGREDINMAVVSFGENGPTVIREMKSTEENNLFENIKDKLGHSGEESYLALGYIVAGRLLETSSGKQKYLIVFSDGISNVDSSERIVKMELTKEEELFLHQQGWIDAIDVTGWEATACQQRLLKKIEWWLDKENSKKIPPLINNSKKQLCEHLEKYMEIITTYGDEGNWWHDDRGNGSPQWLKLQRAWLELVDIIGSSSEEEAGKWLDDKTEENKRASLGRYVDTHGKKVDFDYEEAWEFPRKVRREFESLLETNSEGKKLAGRIKKYPKSEHIIELIAFAEKTIPYLKHDVPGWVGNELWDGTPFILPLGAVQPGAKVHGDVNLFQRGCNMEGIMVETILDVLKNRKYLTEAIHLYRVYTPGHVATCVWDADRYNGFIVDRFQYYPGEISPAFETGKAWEESAYNYHREAADYNDLIPYFLLTDQGGAREDDKFLDEWFQEHVTTKEEMKSEIYIVNKLRRKGETQDFVILNYFLGHGHLIPGDVIHPIGFSSLKAKVGHFLERAGLASEVKVSKATKLSELEPYLKLYFIHFYPESPAVHKMYPDWAVVLGKEKEYAPPLYFYFIPLQGDVELQRTHPGWPRLLD